MTLADLDAELQHAASHGFCAPLVEAWSAAADAEMMVRLAAVDLASLPVNQRIRTAVLTRLAILTPHKAAARRAALFLAFPLQGPRAARLLAQTTDAMWRAAGDTAADFNWYTKRATLAAVYAATTIAWFGDDTPDAGATARFLDARLENIRRYDKRRRQVFAACRPATAARNDR